MATAAQIDDYIRHLEQDRQLSATTLRGYREELDQLVAGHVPLNYRGLSAFVSAGEGGQPLAPTTRNRRLTIVRGFVRFLRRQHVLRSDPTTRLERARIPRNNHGGVTVEEVGLLLRAVRVGTAGWMRSRDLALIGLIFYTGLRVSEIRRIRLDQVDLDQAVLRSVLRKGGMLTDLPLADPARECLQRWLVVRPRASADFLFVGRGGHGLTSRAIEKRLRRHGMAAGLGARAFPHALRHTHATTLARVGVDIELVRRSMNHASLATTARYLHSDDELLRVALAKLPRLDLEGDDPEDAKAELRDR